MRWLTISPSGDVMESTIIRLYTLPPLPSAADDSRLTAAGRDHRDGLPDGDMNGLGGAHLMSFK